MLLRYFCHYDSLTGFGRAARDYLAALAATRPDVELEIVSFGTGGNAGRSPEPRYQHLDELVIAGVADWRAELAANSSGEPDVAVVHASPRALAQIPWPIDRVTTRVVAMTTWETSALPTAYAAALRTRYDAVMVPSDFCFGTLYSAGVGNAVVVPHTFDPGFWPADFHASRERTRFYTIGAWGERKNAGGVLRAYLHAFTKADNVTLVMILQGADFDALRSLIARSGLAPDQLPEIIVPDRTVLAEHELVDLHASGHCFVSATRGEGWGLGMFEAAIMGRPVIAPVWGGQAEFLRYASWSQVPCQPTPCFGGELGADGPFRQAAMAVSMPPGVDCRQLWAEPNLGVMAEAMRERAAGGMPTAARTRIDRAELDIRFGYKKVGPQLADLLEDIAR